MNSNLAELVAELEEQRTRLLAAEALVATEIQRLASFLPAQAEEAWRVAEKDREIGRLWGRVHELEALERHHCEVIAAKDEEITSLIHRLRGL